MNKTILFYWLVRFLPLYSVVSLQTNYILYHGKNQLQTIKQYDCNKWLCKCCSCVTRYIWILMVECIHHNVHVVLRRQIPSAEQVRIFGGTSGPIPVFVVIQVVWLNFRFFIGQAWCLYCYCFCIICVLFALLFLN